MKKFSFRLQKVLDYRDSVKKEQAAELARTHHALAEEERYLDRLCHNHDASDLSNIRSAEEIEMAARFKESVRRQLLQQRKVIAEATDAVEAAREMYVQRARESEVLTMLRQRRFDEFHEEEKIVQRKVNDRIVVQRHGSHKGSEGEE